MPTRTRTVKLRATRASGIALFFGFFLVVGDYRAQDLAPRAYVITPIHSNAITLTYSFYDGNILFDGTLPITDSSARVSVPVISYSHSMRFFGRTASFSASLPYGIGNFRATVAGGGVLAYRSGLLGPYFRFAVNLIGGPPMNSDQFRAWRQKTILGASVKVVPLAGQYDPGKLINLGTNRWAVKPELGYSRRRGHWILDAYAAGWIFTENHEFFPGTNIQSESPTGAFEAHLSYDFRPFFWVSLDGNFWFGGTTALNGVPNPATLQRSSRVGGTASIPLANHQSLKISYSDGAYIRYGGNFQNVSVAWQYSWVGRPN